MAQSSTRGLGNGESVSGADHSLGEIVKALIPEHPTSRMGGRVGEGGVEGEAEADWRWRRGIRGRCRRHREISWPALVAAQVLEGAIFRVKSWTRRAELPDRVLPAHRLVAGRGKARVDLTHCMPGNRSV
jgi:hypothetical protein